MANTKARNVKRGGELIWMDLLMVDVNVSVTLSMFNSQALAFHTDVECCVSDVAGRLFLNAMSGTQIYFDKETNAGETYFYKLASKDTGNTSAASLIRGVEPLNIADLNEFIITAQPQELDFVCTGKVTKFNADKG
ncbi:hypothetical protein Bca4012_019412 [Brassica carinata]